MTIENFEEDFIGAIRMCLSGMTEREMAKRSGVASSYLNSLKNKKKPPRALSVDTLLKLFPHAQITLNAGDQINGNATTGHGPAIVGHHNHVTAPAEDSAETFRSKAIAAMIDLDIPADALREVLKTLKDLPLEAKP